MPWKSRWSFDLPITSVADYLFESPDARLSSTPLIIDAEKPEYYLSKHTYREWSKRLAAGLRKAGFKDGDRLLLYSGNTIFFPVVLMGANMAGGIFSGANPGYVARELAYQISDSGAKFVIAAEASLDIALDAIKDIGFPQERLFVFDDGYRSFDGKGQDVQGIKHWSSLLASPEEGRRYRWPEYKSHEEMQVTAALNYSSGTTGVPKGVEISQLNYIANSMLVSHVMETHDDYAEYVKRARGLSFLPMYHAYGQTYHCINYAKRNIPVYVMRKFDLLKMLEYIQKYRITEMNLVPPIAIAVAKRKEVDDYDLSSVEFAGSGAAPLGPQPAADFEKRLGNRLTMTQGWGMTEVTCTATIIAPKAVVPHGTVGELGPNIEAKIVDLDGNEVPDGERGEFWLRGPNMMKGYWRKPGPTKETITPDGWLKTGDVVFKDKDGFLFVVDRIKELIKVKGNQVAPAELEGLLLDHPAVMDAAVVGVTINGEEMPRAYVVLKEDLQDPASAPQDIAQWLSTKVSRHKRLTGGVKAVEAIPKNPSGKILRKILREVAKTEVGDNEERAKGSRL